MAVRPVFIPETSLVGVTEKMLDFKWHPGMSATQKKKSVIELHNVAKENGLNNILEISSKSELDLGIKLSAFNLLITTKKHNNSFTVETAFQGSKVFKSGGPYRDLFGMDSRAAKKDIRLRESGSLIGFSFYSHSFPLIPRTYFYDWLYINALVQNAELSEAVMKFNCFSDIEFNPKKSINCQAHAVALYISLRNHGCLDKALESPDSFLNFCQAHYDSQDRNIAIQSSMF